MTRLRWHRPCWQILSCSILPLECSSQSAPAFSCSVSSVLAAFQHSVDALFKNAANVKRLEQSLMENHTSESFWVGTYLVWCSEYPQLQSLTGYDDVRTAGKAPPLSLSGLLLWVRGPAPCPRETLVLGEYERGGHIHTRTYRGSIFSAGMLFIMLLWITWNYRTDSGSQGVQVCRKSSHAVHAMHTLLW